MVNENIKAIKDAYVKAGVEALDVQAESEFDSIRNLAQDFLKTVILTQEQLNKSQEDLKKQYKITSSIYNYLNNQEETDLLIDRLLNIRTDIEKLQSLQTATKAKEYFNNVVIQGALLEAELNRLMNRETELIYVLDTENGPVLYSLTGAAEQAAMRTESHQGVFQKRFITDAQFKKQLLGDSNIQGLKNLEKETRELNKNKNTITGIKATYKEALNRASKYQFILWRLPETIGFNRTWGKGNVHGKIIHHKNGNAPSFSFQRGTFKETYANAVLKYLSLFKGKDQVWMMHYFMLLTAQVDSTPGLLKGDISVSLGEDQKSIEYAIKSNRAQAAGLSTLWDFAKTIVTATANKTSIKLAIENYLIDLSNQTTNQLAQVELGIKESAEEIIAAQVRLLGINIQ